MSKKTNALKREARRRRKPLRGKRRNPAFNMGIMSNASLIRCVETIAFGELGCAILRAVKITPINLLTVPNDSNDSSAETIQ